MAAASPDTSATIKRGHLAIRQLACVPQAQRRYVQMGVMRDVVGDLDDLVDCLDQVVQAGALTSDQAAETREVHSLLHHGLGTHANFFEDDELAPHEFLRGNALENDDWEAVRQTARRLYADIAGDQSSFSGVYAT